LLADQVRPMRDFDNRALPSPHDLLLLDLLRQRTHILLDLATCETQPVSWDNRTMRGGTDAGRDRFAAQARATPPFRQAGGRRAGTEKGRLHLDEADRSVSVVDLPEASGIVWPAGHGIVWPDRHGWRALDFARRRVVEIEWPSRAYAVDGVWLLGPRLHHPD